MGSPRPPSARARGLDENKRRIPGIDAHARHHSGLDPCRRCVGRSRRRAAALLGILLGSSFLAAPVRSQEPPLWNRLEGGPHDVGFKRIWTLDSTRVWPRSPAIDSARGEIARPVRIDVWYPASCPGGERMALRGYLEADALGSAFRDLVFLTRRWDEYSYRSLAGDSASFERLMTAKTAACRDATPAPGMFPLIVYSSGWFNRAPDNTVLAEVLASHGLIVAGIPQLNPGLWTFEFASDPASVEHQVRDLEVALATLAGDALVDRRRIAAMGYSTGGDVALLLQSRNPLVDAVVGLDATWTLGTDDDVSGSPLFEPDHATVPVLAVRRPVDDREASDQILRSLEGATRLVVEVPGADHGTFSDDPPQRAFLGTGEPGGTAAHGAVVRAVTRFLLAVLASDGETFDAGALERRYRSGGLDARLIRPTRPTSPDSVRTSPTPADRRPSGTRPGPSRLR